MHTNKFKFKPNFLQSLCCTEIAHACCYETKKILTACFGSRKLFH